MALIVLCRRNGVEFTHRILRLFFTPLQMVENLISLRTRKNRVVLFNPLPNRVDWKAKWVAVESRIGFPFRPLVGQCLKWDPVTSSAELSMLEIKFLSIVFAALGYDQRSQTKVYSTTDLLDKESLTWYRIEPGLEARKSELQFEEDQEYPSWTLHPGRVFSSECVMCRVTDLEGCQTAHSR